MSLPRHLLGLTLGGALFACAACSPDGIAWPLGQGVAGDAPQAGLSSQPRAGVGAGVGAGGGAGFAGAADVFDPCLGDPETETQLAMALNYAIEDGKFCLDRPLAVQPELHCQAYLLAGSLAFLLENQRVGRPLPTWITSLLGWHAPDPDGPRWWSTLEAASVSEARSQMLSEDSQEFCNSALRTPYKSVAVSHVGQSWALVFRSD